MPEKLSELLRLLNENVYSERDVAKISILRLIQLIPPMQELIEDNEEMLLSLKYESEIDEDIKTKSKTFCVLKITKTL